MRQQLTVLTAPAYEPVSLLEARRWCRLEDDDTANTPVLQLLIKAMREFAENLTFRAFVSRTYRLYMDQWPICEGGNRIELQFPPLISVESVKYRDINGTLQTLAADQYVVHSWREPAIVVPEWLVIWPLIRSVPDTIQVSYTAGYAPGSPSDEASNQEAIPAKLRLWMEARLATLFDRRGQLVEGQVVSIPRDFTDGLLDSLVVGTRLF